MIDRLLVRTLNLAVMGLIVAAAAGALVLGYRGLFLMVTSRPEEGLMHAGLGVMLGAACYLLCRHRHELADS